MTPKIPCLNCQVNEWFENNELRYFPQVIKLENGQYDADTKNGIHI